MATLAPKQRSVTSPVSTGPAPARHSTARSLSVQRSPVNLPSAARIPLGRSESPRDGEEKFSAQEREPRMVDAASSLSRPDFTRIPVHALSAPRIQTKLAINKPGDEFEQEADRVAERVMRMPAAASNMPRSARTALGVQRKCACGGSFDESIKTSSEDEPCHLQRNSISPSALGPAVAPPIVHSVLSSLGQPLDVTTRSFMEPRFGHDFSLVRVHTDARAAESARAIDARAFTVGHQIVFGAGQYQPTTANARTLIAHELAHVVQQSRSEIGYLQRDTVNKSPTMTAPKSPLEEAKAEERAVVIHWTQTKGSVANSPEIKDWIDTGDAIVALMDAHEEGYERAVMAQDLDLAVAYKKILISDAVALDYVSLHVTVYSKLLKIRSRVDSIVNSFDHDKRKFAGRHEAETNIRLLKRLLDGVPKDSTTQLAKLGTHKWYKFHPGQPNERLIRVTDEADPSKLAELAREAKELKALDLSVGAIVEKENAFLHEAFKEGAHQAKEAVEEYIELMNQIVDLDGDSDDASDDDDSTGSDDPARSGDGATKSQDDSKGSGDPAKKKDGSKKSSDKEKGKKQNKREDYQCNAKCQQKCTHNVEGWATGTSRKNCGDATRNAKANIKRGCTPRHCNCEDNRGFRGNGHACEAHTR